MLTMSPPIILPRLFPENFQVWNISKIIFYNEIRFTYRL